MERLRRVPDWAWLLLGFVLRAAFAVSLGGRTIQIDEAAIDGAAWNLAAVGALGPPGTTMAPLAPTFYSVFYWLGHYPVRARLANAVVSTWMAWMIGKATNEVTESEDAGKLALALSCIYPFFIYYSGALMSETPYLAMTVWGVWELSKSLRRGSVAAAARAGLALGLGALARPEGAYIWLVIWCFAAAFACARGRWPWRSWVVAVCCWLVPILGWCGRNRVMTGRFALDLHGGSTLLHGTMFLAQNEIDTSVAVETMEAQPFYQEAMKLSPAESDKALTHAAFEFMRTHKRLTVEQWGRKLVNFWRLWPRTDKSYHETGISHPGAGLSRMALVAISLCFEPWLILLGLYGLGRLWLADERAFAPTLFLLGTMGIHVLSVSQMRYRLPAMPWLILGACWVLARGRRTPPPEARPRTSP